jgi:hypothetical protein
MADGERRRSGGVEVAAAIDGFLTHLAVERGLARNTLEAYRRDLERLAAHLAEALVGPAFERDVAEVLADLDVVVALPAGLFGDNGSEPEQIGPPVARFAKFEQPGAGLADARDLARGVSAPGLLDALVVAGVGHDDGQDALERVSEAPVALKELGEEEPLRFDGSIRVRHQGIGE